MATIPALFSEILFEKLYWTFQTENIGNLVSKTTDEHLSCTIELEKNLYFNYDFSKETTRQIQRINTNIRAPIDKKSIFLPAKEILSIHKNILKSRDQDKVFGYDDTYVDLARALLNPTTKGRNPNSFSKSQKNLKK